MLDILQFLKDYNIPYRDHGSGVKIGNVVIHCPFCADSAKGDYLGIQLSTGKWGCWKIDSHRSGNLAYLVKELLQCDYEEALRIVGKEKRIIRVNDFNSLVEGVYFDKKEETENNQIESLLLPKNFRPLWKNGFRRELFLGYLEDRGFDDPVGLSEKYKLHYCLSGKYKFRIVIPIFYEKKIVTFTARSIYKSVDLRYTTLSNQESIKNPKNILYNADFSKKRRNILFVVEGPFDVLKMDFYLKNSSAVSLLGLTISDSQLFQLIELSGRYKKVVLLLDEGADTSNLNNLSLVNNLVLGDLDGVLDPGKLTKFEVIKQEEKYSATSEIEKEENRTCSSKKNKRRDVKRRS